VATSTASKSTKEKQLPAHSISIEIYSGIAWWLLLSHRIVNFLSQKTLLSSTKIQRLFSFVWFLSSYWFSFSEIN